VYGFPTRTPGIQRESLILNLGREDVREHIWRCFSHLIREYHVKHFKFCGTRNTTRFELERAHAV
jgi:hypothetical protein